MIPDARFEFALKQQGPTPRRSPESFPPSKNPNPFIATEEDSRRFPTARQTADSKAFGTIDENFNIYLRELQYPGKSVEVPIGRWAYVFDASTKSCLVEAQRVKGPGKIATSVYGPDPDEWANRDENTWQYRVDGITVASQGVDVELPLSDIGGIGLRNVIDSQSFDFWVFLAPFRLSSKGLEFLLDDLKSNGTGNNTPLVRTRIVSHAWLEAWVPEPFSWSASANQEWFWRLGDSYINWIQSDERQYELFIASTLEGWIQNGADQIPGHLKTQPSKYIKTYQKDETRLRKQVEIAAAYTVHCIDSPEHRAVEISGMEHGKQALSETYQNWGLVLLGLSVAKPGIKYLTLLLTQSDRLPVRYLFAEKRPDNDLDFNNYRYAFIGFKESLKELIGPWVSKKLRDSHSKAVRIAIDMVNDEILNRLASRLKGLGVGVRKGIYKSAYENLVGGKKPITGTKGPYKGRVFRSFPTVHAKIDGTAVKDRISRITTSTDTFVHSAYRWSDRLTTPIGAVFEIVNFVNAVEAYRKSNPEDKAEKTWGVVGDSADLVAFSLAVAESFIATSGSKKGVRSPSNVRAAVGLRGLSGGFAAVAGVCQMKDEVENLAGGLSQDNYASAVGSTFAAVGAGMTAVAGGMAAAWAVSFALGGEVVFFASGGGPIGAIIGVIGALLICVGTFFATIFKRDPYEQFAAHCFLGDNYKPSNGMVHYNWAKSGLNTKDRKDEALVLHGLMGAFGLELKGTHHTYEKKQGGLPMNTIVFRPSYFPKGGKLFVRFQQKYAGTTYSEIATVSDTSDSLRTEQGNLWHDSRYDKIERDEHGRITQISFTTRPAFVYDGKKSYHFLDDFPQATSLQSNKVQARLELGYAAILVPPGGTWVELDLKKDRKKSSFDK